MTPKNNRSLVVVGDPAGRIGRIDGSGQGIEQTTEAPFAFAQTSPATGGFRQWE